jgi:hypothetical protein
MNPPSSPLKKSRLKWKIFSSKSPEEIYRMHCKVPEDVGGLTVTADSDMMNLIQQLKAERDDKDRLINELSHQVELLSQPSKHQPVSVHRKHVFNTETYLISDNSSGGDNERAPLATRGSLLTTKILRSLPDLLPNPTRPLVDRLLCRIKRPLDNINYLQSLEFGSDLIQISLSLSLLLENELRCSYLESPVYVMGDIHGNLEDLLFFSDNIFPLGVEITAGKYLFLGDYVDRGMNSLECVAYLFALKVLCPSKIFLLR